MLRTRLVQVVSVAVAGLYFSSLAQAQGVRIFAMASGSYLFDEKFFTVNGDQFRSNYANGGKIIFGGEVTPFRILGFEGGYGIGRNNLRVASLAAPISEAGYGVRVQRYNGNAVLHSPIALGGLRPYLTGGIEYTHVAPTSDAKTKAFSQGFAGQVGTVLGANNMLGANLGGGVEWGFLPALGLRLDLRNHFMGTPTYGLPQGPSATPYYPVSGRANNLELSAGITFHVGR